jgi:GT2 family glycosyltransferase
MCSSPSILCYNDAGVPEGTIEFYDDWELEFFPFCMAFRNALPTSACVIRRTTLDKAGLFDESRELQFAEDYEMWLRLLSLDERFLLLSEPSAFYRKHPAGVTSDRSRSRRFHQALAAKRMPYIFSLQKVALENLIYRFRTLSQQVHSQNVEIQRQQGRIQILEETNQRTRAYFPIRTLLLLRRWMAARLSGKLSQGKKKAAEIKLT